MHACFDLDLIVYMHRDDLITSCVQAKKARTESGPRPKYYQVNQNRSIPRGRDLRVLCTCNADARKQWQRQKFTGAFGMVL